MRSVSFQLNTATHASVSAALYGREARYRPCWVMFCEVDFRISMNRRTRGDR